MRLTNKILTDTIYDIMHEGLLDPMKKQQELADFIVADQRERGRNKVLTNSTKLESVDLPVEFWRDGS